MATVDTSGSSRTTTETTPMGGLSLRWWAFVLRGLAAVAFGVLCWILPGLSLLGLVFMFGAWAIFEGILAMAAAFRHEAQEPPSWMLALQGIAGILAGLGAFFVPGITAFALLMLIAAWSMIAGVLQIVTAIRLRKEIRGEWLLALGGVLSVIFGVLLVVFPGAGALALVFWIGGFAVVFGALLVALGLRMLRTRNQIERGTGTQQQRSIGGYASSH